MTEPIEPNDDLAAWSQELAPVPDESGHITYTPEPEATEDDAELDPRALAAMQKLRRENQSLRTRMRESEATIGAAAARESAHQRAVIEAAAKQAGFYDPADFLALRPDTSEYINEFNEVVHDKVAEAAQAVLDAKPYLGSRRAPPTQQPIEGLRGGASPEVKQQPVTWSSALRGR